MRGYPHSLYVNPAGTRDAYDPTTGDRVDGFYEVDEEEAAAYLPHQCDEWVIGSGTTTDVIAELRKLRDEVDAAIKFLEQQDEETA